MERTCLHAHIAEETKVSALNSIIIARTFIAHRASAGLRFGWLVGFSAALGSLVGYAPFTIDDPDRRMALCSLNARFPH